MGTKERLNFLIKDGPFNVKVTIYNSQNVWAVAFLIGQKDQSVLRLGGKIF